MGTKRKAEQEPAADQADDLDSSSSGLTEESGSQTSSDSGSSGSYPSVSSGGAADSDAETDGGETVQVDFEFFDPQELDFHGLKALLQTYLDGEAFSCSELVDAIIQQVSFRHRKSVIHGRTAILRLLNAQPPRRAAVSTQHSAEVEMLQR